MNKQQFIQGIKQQHIDPHLTYNYFLSKGGRGTFEQFYMVFRERMDDVFQFFLKEFKLTSLWDKDGNFLRIVE